MTNKKKRYKVIFEAEGGNRYVTSYFYAKNDKALIKEIERRGKLQQLMTYDCVSE